MSERSLNILQISATDNFGGAAGIAWDLHNAYTQRGMTSLMAVGNKYSNDPAVYEFPGDRARPAYVRIIRNKADQLHQQGYRKRPAALRWLAEPIRQTQLYLGIEDFNYPSSRFLLSLIERNDVDVIHLHNLHGGYFDLRMLRRLSEKKPVVFTLHDTWLLTGHCGYAIDCERWKTGCGSCPDLNIYPSVRRDATRFNWKRKRDIYKTSRYYIAGPSEWVIQQSLESVVNTGAVAIQTIPNGVDLTVFRKANKQSAREELSLPPDCFLLLCSGAGISSNPFKDFQTIQRAVEKAARFASQKLVLLVAGEKGDAVDKENWRMQFIPYTQNRLQMARIYQAADLCLHAAHADNFPNIILESLACATPVIATAVGGIPEQIKPLKANATPENLNTYSMEQATGMLVSRANADAMAESICFLLASVDVRRKMEQNADRDATERFSVDLCASRYLEFYAEIARSEINRIV